MFDFLDPHSNHGSVYRALVTHPRSSVIAISGQTGLTTTEVEAALHEMENADAVTRATSYGDATSYWDAVPPDQVTTAAIRWDEDRRARMREASAELAKIYWFARGDQNNYPALEVIEDSATLVTRHRNLHTGASEQIRRIDRPPYSEFTDTEEESLKRARLAAGIRYRTIYHEAAYDDAARAAEMMRTVRCGEQARTLGEPPMKLVIGDDQYALMPLDPFDPVKPVCLVVRPSGLLTALIEVFESLWRLSMPVSPDGCHEPIDDRDREIITLMATGATDDAIARQLRLSRRTVVRRMASLLERLGATTRFQAGVQASRRGWL